MIISIAWFCFYSFSLPCHHHSNVHRNAIYETSNVGGSQKDVADVCYRRCSLITVQYPSSIQGMFTLTCFVMFSLFVVAS